MLGLDPRPTERLAQVLAGNALAQGMSPYAQCYGGHQFGSWARQLGDGRAITLAEVQDHQQNTWDLQLKGAGPTPYSRRADGRAVLRSSVRELVCSEAMAHLGVPTTRALALVLTGDEVLRDMFYDGHAQLEPGAIVTRVAPSFVRFGTFELPASRDDRETLSRVFEFVLSRHFADISPADPLRVSKLFARVVETTIEMVVHWMRVGFVHGVMNTDNMSILGLTIDYGPYGWVEPFDPEWTPNTTDAEGRRYCFGNQPRVAIWNLMKLATALAPLCDDIEPLKQELLTLTKRFDQSLQAMALRKLGLHSLGNSQADREDVALVQRMSQLLTACETDMTLFFRALATLSCASTPERPTIERHFEHCFYQPERRAPSDREQLADWISSYAIRTQAESSRVTDAQRCATMNSVNPLYVPRNYLLQQVIDRVAQGEFEAVTELLDVLRNPYTEQPGRDSFAAKRPEWARTRAGCSMLSCSS